MRRNSSWLAGGALLALVANASAQSLSVQYRGPADCTSARAIEGEVERIVGKPLAELGSSWKQVECSIEPQADRWFLRVRVVPVLGDAKERTLLAPTCSEAAEAAFLVVATSLTHGEGARDKNADGPATERAAAAGAPGPPAPPPLLAPMAPPIAPAERPATAAAKSSSEPPGEARLRLVTSVYGGAQFVSLPTPAAFFDLGLGLSLKRVLVSAHFSATLPQDVALPRTRGGAEVSLMAGGIDGCFLAIPVLRGCAGFELGHIQARGYDVAKGREASAFWSALRLGATFAWPLGRHWAALANANIIQSFQSFDVLVAPSGAGYRYQLRSPGLRLGLGLELAW